MILPGTLIPFHASTAVLEALGRAGRTEDIRFSPNRRQIAIACYEENRILRLDVNIRPTSVGSYIQLHDFLEISSPKLHEPHGLCWIDNATLIVGNRSGDIQILRIPSGKPTSEKLDIIPISTLPSGEAGLIKYPGSVSLKNLGCGLHELWACNNYLHYVSCHILDHNKSYASVAEAIIIQNSLDIPDGIACSRDGKWIAVSNHTCQQVVVFENTPELGRSSTPCGVLQGVTYPHGLCVSAGNQIILVADAGAPYVHIYTNRGKGWRGLRDPDWSIAVMDQDAFQRGHYNPQEGGPKGVDIDHPTGILVTSCQEQPIAFFDLNFILKDGLDNLTTCAQLDSEEVTTFCMRTALLRQVYRLSETNKALEEAIDKSTTCFNKIIRLYHRMLTRRTPKST